ncbi:SCP2 sterol-binding domain-containing protein [Nocardia inohanensis]|uniref:SCP2 sterol-binding domain-containing protein n=1 Tax=Nocardia inohanensis TaxID=209246 RepID=UPI000836E0AD|nr:SCP2 sterol-binding domain-containing protein [Nocardia inohanensis]
MSSSSQFPTAPATLAQAAEFNAIVARIDDRTLRTAMADPMTRAVVLGAVFAGMPQRVRGDKIDGVSAVIRWRIGDEPDCWTVLIDGGACAVRSGMTSRTPTVTLELGTVPFLRMIAGQTGGMALVLSGKLRIKGSLTIARHLEDWFARG